MKETILHFDPFSLCLLIICLLWEPRHTFQLILVENRKWGRHGKTPHPTDVKVMCQQHHQVYVRVCASCVVGLSTFLLTFFFFFEALGHSCMCKKTDSDKVNQQALISPHLCWIFVRTVEEESQRKMWNSHWMLLTLHVFFFSICKKLHPPQHIWQSDKVEVYLVKIVKCVLITRLCDSEYLWIRALPVLMSSPVTSSQIKPDSPQTDVCVCLFFLFFFYCSLWRTLDFLFTSSPRRRPRARLSGLFHVVIRRHNNVLMWQMWV